MYIMNNEKKKWKLNKKIENPPEIRLEIPAEIKVEETIKDVEAPKEPIIKVVEPEPEPEKTNIAPVQVKEPEKKVKVKKEKKAETKSKPKTKSVSKDLDMGNIERVKSTKEPDSSQKSGTSTKEFDVKPTTEDKDRLEMMMKKIITKDKAFTATPMKKIAWGKYQFGNTIITLREVNGFLLVRIGGGWLRFEEFLKTHQNERSSAPPTSKVEKLKPTKPITREYSFMKPTKSSSIKREISKQQLTRSASMPDFSAVKEPSETPKKITSSNSNPTPSKESTSKESIHQRSYSYSTNTTPYSSLGRSFSSKNKMDFSQSQTSLGRSFASKNTLPNRNPSSTNLNTPKNLPATSTSTSTSVRKPLARASTITLFQNKS